LSDLRESGAIEMDADVVVFLHRPLDHGQQMVEIGNVSVSAANLVECILAKQRNGPIMSFWLDWHAQNASFTEHILPLQASAGTDYYAGAGLEVDEDFA
jgi:replicative DNA helicase